jgi:hypothetical protein
MKATIVLSFQNCFHFRHESEKRKEIKIEKQSVTKNQNQNQVSNFFSSDFFLFSFGQMIMHLCGVIASLWFDLLSQTSTSTLAFPSAHLLNK